MFTTTSPGLLRAACLLCLLLLQACASSPSAPPVAGADQLETLSRLQNWEIEGRLNIRQQRSSDTLNLNWTQRSDSFAIRISGTLGLGAVYLHGDDSGATLEKSGEEPLQLPDLDALGREYLDYDFPAAYLLWWVRGLPVPSLQTEHSSSEEMLLQELTQSAPTGQRWTLRYDRYTSVDGLALPGRIRLDSQGVTLTFLISDWHLDVAAD